MMSGYSPTDSLDPNNNNTNTFKFFSNTPLPMILTADDPTTQQPVHAQPTPPPPLDLSKIYGPGHNYIIQQITIELHVTLSTTSTKPRKHTNTATPANAALTLQSLKHHARGSSTLEAEFKTFHTMVGKKRHSAEYVAATIVYLEGKGSRWFIIEAAAISAGAVMANLFNAAAEAVHTAVVERKYLTPGGKSVMLSSGGKLNLEV